MAPPWVRTKRKPMHIIAEIQSIVKKDTVTYIIIADIWESPDISKTHSQSQTGQEEFTVVSPGLSLNLVHNQICGGVAIILNGTDHGFQGLIVLVTPF